MRRIESIRYPKHQPAPLMRTRYRYAGESDEHFTCGEVYTVIGSGDHWFRELGFGVWMTYDEFPVNQSWDIDYGCFVDTDWFHQHFLEV